MKLSQIAELLLLSQMDGTDVEFSGVETDSRSIQPGDLFICLPGSKQDGHDYAEQAVHSGAAALVVERKLEIEIPQLIVPDARFAMAVIANHVYDYPSRKLRMIGITGTNGKTTTTYLIEKILQDAGRKTGLMGTIRMKIGDEQFDVKNTTQEALELQRNLRKMADAGADCCVMEVSSHALDLGRVKGTRFRTAIFTNLTQDHLDYHQTMERYRDAKALFFSQLGNEFHMEPGERKYAVLNADDTASEHFRRVTAAQIVTYGIESDADVRATDLEITAKGIRFNLKSFAGSLPFQLQLHGRFNAYNALAAITAGLIEGIPLEQIRASLEQMKAIDGRMEAVEENQDFLVFVDYAHTPDGLENVLSTIKAFASKRIITVFGCGGDRDRTKRPIMGAIAAKYSDYAFVTSDNPRSEDPRSILDDIVPGVLETGMRQEQFELQVDRKAAIQKAIEMASPGDVVLIAGKGHETYQTIQGVNHFFDDRVVAKEAIRSRNH